jgi:hypothetical protein
MKLHEDDDQISHHSNVVEMAISFPGGAGHRFSLGSLQVV